MKYFVIFLVLIGFVGTIFAIPPFDSQEIFDFSNTIVVGKIISVNSTFSPTHSLYHIQVEKFLKNSQDSQVIVASGQNTVFSRLGNEVFHVGDRALFFLTSNYVGYDKYSDILSIHPTTRSVESEWDACDIFANDIPQEHWVFGGVGPSVKASQENKTRDFVTGKEILITHDISNPTPVEKKIDFGMTIKNIDDPNSLYIFSEISNIVLEPCVPYHTLTWTFTPAKAGNYRFEFDNLMGSRHTLGMEIKQNILSKNYSSVLSLLKQFKSGISFDEIECREELVLVQKYNSFPACVTESTKQKLIERGWALTKLKPELEPEDESDVMKKARELGINNIMEAVDSEKLTSDEKREYIKIRYEESPNNIPSLNIRIKDFTRNLEFGERPTFTLIETGYAIPCTHPTLEVYLLKQEIGNDHTPDDLVYEDKIVHSCPSFGSFYPVLKFWDETDFKPFPVCEKEGRYLVVGDSGYERGALEEYYCNAPYKN
ncbi:hypothetical protein [Nitrosarchaeum sp. AC2]|uniref:hypothetical protein n=1 Tax=Nitrosarchaeum sp. AC2 TaxID=2259673 RepID=UPI0015CD2D87|nr:hypothetical protein [Nitrosarchaeum sp. AC2]QLH10825.1 hypothetical protein DSQ20_04580 [Nitrosarchaeum sp. AC2]